MQNDLLAKKCLPCEGKALALKPEQIKELLPQIPGWRLTEDGKQIYRHFKFKGFYKVMGLINAIAWIAQQEMHHPDIKFGYDYCEVNYATHAINGLTENDFICARKINELVKDDAGVS